MIPYNISTTHIIIYLQNNNFKHFLSDIVSPTKYIDKEKKAPTTK